MRGSKLFGNSLVLHAEYESVDGLISGNSITINGVTVGRVGAVDLDFGRKIVKVRLDFTQNLELPDNSEALLASADVLGSKEIQIVQNPGVTATRVLQTGDQITGTTEKGIMDVAEDLVETRGAQILIEVARLSQELNQLVKLTREALEDPDSRYAINNTIDNLNKSSENVKSLTAKTDSLLASFSGIADNANSIIGTVKSREDDIQGILSNVRVTTDSLRTASGDIKSLMADASSAVGSVEEVISNLANDESTLGLLLNDRQLYDSLTSTTGNINALLREVNNNPQRFFDDIKIYLIERKPPKAKKGE